jgi:hypothetical protein
VAGLAVLTPTSARAAVQPALVEPCSTGSVTVVATIPNVLQGAETAAFGLTLTPSGGGAATPASLSFAAAQTSRSTTVTGLSLGSYTVHETLTAAWVAQSDTTITLSPSQCAATTGFSNAIHAATVSFQTVTVPAGSEAGWQFTLVGPGTPPGGEKLLTTGAAPTLFSTQLREGFYTVAQTTLTGWDQTGSTGCLVTVDYPADAGHAFTCQVTDTRRGHVTVLATHGGAAPSGSDAFGYTLAGGPSAVILSRVADAADSGSLDFGLLQPGTYTLCQHRPAAGWSTSLVAEGGLPNAGGDICLPFLLSAGQTRAFSIDNASPAVASTPTPTPTPAPTGAVQGVTSPLPTTPPPGGGISVPNTGIGVSTLGGVPLVLLGAALAVTGRRRARRQP